MGKTKLTRKEMIEACVDNQIARGITNIENRDLQIKTRLKGFTNAGIKAMSLVECQKWYNSVFGM